MKKLTEKQIQEIIDNKMIDYCTKDERSQVMAYAFGEDFMASKNKGKKITY